jgi:para-aminobenzoate synthetase / 4-amino-4-deoxychorismate lyase
VLLKGCARMKQNEPLLSFEFADSTGQVRPLTFRKPIRVIEARKIEDVLPCFQLVQDAVDEGLYAAGFLSYESANAFDSAFKVVEGGTLPLLWFGVFSEPGSEEISSQGNYSLTEWKPSVTKEEYDQSIISIKDSIESGDTYQTNYTIRLKSDFQGDHLSYFQKLKRAQSSNYCAYIHTGEHSILSASPELFFHLKGDTITTRPMKGTVKRGRSYEEDQANAEWLYQSEKNRAENVMIVDLLRNDLGVIAENGTVAVSRLYDIEPYPTVHQMTSTITAKISEKAQIADIFKALFPCGSITGAPKISTMKIIADLENAPREVYCGTIGFITPNREAVFNVPIRTVQIEHLTGKAIYGVGGGITWDSTPDGEYDEILAKARLLEENRPEFQLLESLLLENGDYFLLEEHLKRLEESAQYFGFLSNFAEIKEALHEFADKNNSGVYKVRLLFSKNNELTLEAQGVEKQEGPVKVMLGSQPIDDDDPFLFHKTTNRETYTRFQEKKPSDIFDVLLWNKSEELTEFTNGNVVLQINGELWTPPVQSGLLAGTFRGKLIAAGEIREKILTISDLKKCEKIWFINSVRRWIEVQLTDTHSPQLAANG